MKETEYSANSRSMYVLSSYYLLYFVSFLGVGNLALSVYLYFFDPTADIGPDFLIISNCTITLVFSSWGFLCSGVSFSLPMRTESTYVRGDDVLTIGETSLPFIIVRPLLGLKRRYPCSNLVGYKAYGPIFCKLKFYDEGRIVTYRAVPNGPASLNIIGASLMQAKHPLFAKLIFDEFVADLVPKNRERLGLSE